MTTLGAGAEVIQRWQPVRPRRALRARRQGRLPVERRHERRARAGRRRGIHRPRVARAEGVRRLRCTRRSSAPPGCSASTRSTRWAAPARSAPSPTACPASTSTRCRSSPARATSTSPRPSGSCAAWSASTPRPGPTEILVIADATADARLVAADLVSQAEHDELAAAVLVTDSPELADARARPSSSAWPRPPTTPTRVRAALDGQQSAIVLVDDLAAAAAFSNAYGPEHLEIQTAEPGAVLDAHRERRRDLPRRELAGEPRRLPRRLEPRAADRRAVALLARASARTRSCDRSRSSTTTGRRFAAVERADRRAQRRPRTCPRTAPPSLRASTA